MEHFWVLDRFWIALAVWAVTIVPVACLSLWLPRRADRKRIEYNAGVVLTVVRQNGGEIETVGMDELHPWKRKEVVAAVRLLVKRHQVEVEGNVIRVPRLRRVK